MKYRNWKWKFYAILIFTFSSGISTGQNFRAFNNKVSPILNAQGNSHGLFKTSLIFALKKGASVGVSYGMWKENPSLQYSLNTGFMWRFFRGFLGNFRDGANPKDSRSRSQFIFMFTPMLSVNMGKGNYVYQELEPFYLGTPNAVFSKFKYSTTLGSTFTISPRVYRNVATVRNRAQQVFMISLNLKNANLTIYDDYFPFFTEKLQLGDNWDRFFTGGGFFRYRFSDQFTFHLYSEVYTGLNKPNAFLSPDLITYKPTIGRQWKQKNYANQDPGQEYFNSSWLVAKLSYTAPYSVGPGSGTYLPDLDVLVGSAATWTMFLQNLVHSTIPYDNKNKMRLHYFMPRANIPGNLEAGGNTLGRNWKSLFVGGGIHTNITMP